MDFHHLLVDRVNELFKCTPPLSQLKLKSAESSWLLEKPANWRRAAETSTTKCASCGTRVSESDAFCRSCGAKNSDFDLVAALGDQSGRTKGCERGMPAAYKGTELCPGSDEEEATIARFIGDIRRKCARRAESTSMDDVVSWSDSRLMSALGAVVDVSAPNALPDSAVETDPYQGELPLVLATENHVDVDSIVATSLLHASAEVSHVAAAGVGAAAAQAVYAPPSFSPPQLRTQATILKAIRVVLSDIDDPIDKEALLHWWAESLIKLWRAAGNDAPKDVGVYVKAFLDKVSGRSVAARRDWYKAKVGVMKEDLDAKTKAAGKQILAQTKAAAKEVAVKAAAEKAKVDVKESKHKKHDKKHKKHSHGKDKKDKKEKKDK